MSGATLLEDLPAEAVEREPDFLYEIVDGEIREKVMGAREVGLANRIHDQITLYCLPKKLGRPYSEQLFRFELETPQRRPDVAYISAERWPIGRLPPLGAAWEFVPDLAIEVISPNDLGYEIIEKRDEYLQAGVRQVWQVWPEQAEVHVYVSKSDVRVFRRDQTVPGGEVIPGFELSLDELFSSETGAAS